METISIREDLSALSTEDLAKRCFAIATGPYAADQRAMSYLAEFGRRLASLEGEAKAVRQVAEQIATCWTSNEDRRAGADFEPLASVKALDYFIERARAVTGIEAPVFDDEVA